VKELLFLYQFTWSQKTWQMGWKHPSDQRSGHHIYFCWVASLACRNVYATTI